MAIRLLESAVVLLHLLFIAMVVFGALLAFRWPRLLWVQLPVFVWGAAVNLAGWPCPLTTAENALRVRRGEPPYAGSFVAHYLLPGAVARLGGLHLELLVGSFVVLVNAAVYANLLHRWRRRLSAGP
jgi:Protein of Unknown function (DUF2784)